jgi:hypothetical protein
LIRFYDLVLEFINKSLFILLKVIIFLIIISLGLKYGYCFFSLNFLFNNKKKELSKLPLLSGEIFKLRILDTITIFNFILGAVMYIYGFTLIDYIIALFMYSVPLFIGLHLWFFLFNKLKLLNLPLFYRLYLIFYIFSVICQVYFFLLNINLNILFDLLKFTFTFTDMLTNTLNLNFETDMDLCCFSSRFFGNNEPINIFNHPFGHRRYNPWREDSVPHFYHNGRYHHYQLYHCWPNRPHEPIMTYQRHIYPLIDGNQDPRIIEAQLNNFEILYKDGGYARYPGNLTGYHIQSNINEQLRNNPYHFKHFVHDNGLKRWQYCNCQNPIKPQF